MRVLDPLLFLAGHRGAIERIAATRHAWIVGAILVLSAGIARNYDHLDLLREPEWFIGPFAASLVSIVFIFLWLAGPLKLAKVGGWMQLGTFLTFAWMTAPCAWLYGIPVEAMTDIVTATKWNIAFLAIVSLWRVVLMTRAVTVLTGVKHLRAFVLVLSPAALEAMIGSAWKGMSLVQIMGGVRLPPHTQLLQNASFFVAQASFWIFLVTVVACLVVKGVAVRPLHRAWKDSPAKALVASMFAMAAWFAGGIPFQPAVRNRLELKALIENGNFKQAVIFASSKQRLDFPAVYPLPPESDRGFPLKLLEELTPETPEWLRDEWQSSAIESLKAYPTFSAEKLADLENRHPVIAEALRQYARDLRAQLDRKVWVDSDKRRWLDQYERFTGSEPPAESPRPKP